MNDIMGEERTTSLILKIAKELAKKRWYNTQATSFGLLAIGKYLKNKDKGPVSYELHIDDGLVTDVTTNTHLDNLEFDLEKTQAWRIKNKSNAELYVTITRKGKPEMIAQQDVEENLKIRISYLDSNGKSLDVSNLPQGTDFQAVVNITNPGTRFAELDELALDQFIPSGWEIRNDRVADIGSSESLSYDYRDFRDASVHTFFDLKQNAPTKVFSIDLTASYAGKFFQPDISCHAMYDKSILARRSGQWVEVRPNTNEEL